MMQLAFASYDGSEVYIAEIHDNYNKILEYEKERQEAVGGIKKPYPAFQLPTVSNSIYGTLYNPVEINPHWVTYSNEG